MCWPRYAISCQKLTLQKRSAEQRLHHRPRRRRPPNELRGACLRFGALPELHQGADRDLFALREAVTPEAVRVLVGQRERL